MASEGAVPREGSPPPPGPHDEGPESAQKGAVKRSWRRKYRKMRVRFEDTMHTSNTLIRDEFRAVAVARRLQEQNDQIMEVLLDLNDQKRLPPSLRFDLRTLQETEADRAQGPEALQRRLQELRHELVHGLISEDEFAQRAEQLHSAQSAVPTARSLASLEATVPHTTSAPDPPPEGLLLGEHAPGYMSPSHEEEYLLAMDIALGDVNTYDPNSHDGRPLRVPPTRPVPTEKELSIQNPDSVYNWLRKHQPQVFLQDKDPHAPENVSEKSSARPANSHRGKNRQSGINAATPGPKTDQEIEDEPGFVPESSKSKRSAPKEDDHSYKPKGGSSRPSKRKREDGDPPVKGGRKKPSRASGVGAVAGS